MPEEIFPIRSPSRRPLRAYAAAPSGVSPTPPLPVSVTTVAYWHSERQLSAASWIDQVGGRVLAAIGAPVVAVDGAFFNGRVVAQTHESGAAYRGVGLVPVGGVGTRPYLFSVARLRATGAYVAGLINCGIQAAADYVYVNAYTDLFRFEGSGQPTVTTSNDTAVHTFEAFSLPDARVLSVDGADQSVAATATTLPAGTPEVGVGCAASGAYHFGPWSHAFHLCCDNVPTTAERAALRAWAQAYWGTP